ncbi:MAG: RyR domain-containing protein [Anaerolineales bacterium]
MAQTQPSKTKMLITGDYTIDWNISYQKNNLQNTSNQWNPKNLTQACRQPGGAALLADLIQHIINSFPPDQQTLYELIKMGAPQGSVPPDDNRIHHSFAIWSRFPSDQGKVWRVKTYLGLDPALQDNPPPFEDPGVPSGRDADLVILDDAGLGFRNQPEQWLEILNNPEKNPWIVVKMARPVARGPLWDHLIQHNTDRLIAITPANDLRLTEVQISKGLSWERTAQDVVWELVHNPCVNSLARCAHVILPFGTEGAVLLSRGKKQTGEDTSVASQGELFFDPQAIEGTWTDTYPGGMIGYTTCLTASIVYQLLRNREQPDIRQGIQAGFSALRELHRGGYEEKMGSNDRSKVTFPHQTITQEITREGTPLAHVAIQDPVRSLHQTVETMDPDSQPEFWTILNDRHRHDLDRVAEQTVLEGIEHALPDVPFGTFGYLVTVDRQEIESFRTICTLVDEYLKKERPGRPLSIGVFGAPGSGKSFGITQVAHSLAPGVIEKLEFNLSQMNSPAELPDALHQVRDLNLEGKIPLVFWDEFDTSLGDKPLGWLRYFLAPMQDGAFREGQIIHPIGRSIFVFAGGTSHTMHAFGKGLSEEEARAAKVPDFVSRLKGYVDVLGPNPQEGKDDPYFIIRRAILLRSLLLRNHPALFQKENRLRKLQIDQGVLRAFLHISHYTHGIRSMETILTMSQLSGKTNFARSSLPSESQLDLHVSGQEFLSLVQQVNLEGDILEKLARSHHQLFCQQMEEKGYQYGPTTDEEQKTHSALLPWEELPEHEKEQNRSAVRDIPQKLSQIGYVMVPARSNEPAHFPRGKQDLETLSRLEHKRWMKAKLEDGWEYAPETNKEEKLHKALLPWDDERLAEEEKDKDRDLIRAIPKLLSEIGYTVVDINEDQGG